MRPVNLIPAELRRGDTAPLRTGPLAYIVLGALALALAGVSMLVLAANEVSEKKDELVALRREDAAAKVRAERLAPYAQFQAVSQERVETVASLANSRFDWPRVMRELALILPEDVVLENLNANAGAEGGESGGGELGGSLGPSLELDGCTSGQNGVARFVTALKAIDGVTRVGLQSSSVGSGGEGGGESGGGCGSGDLKAQFSLTAAFDAAPVPVATTEAEAAPEAETAESGEEPTEEAGEGG